MPSKLQLKEHAVTPPPTVYSLLAGKLGIPEVRSEADLVRLVQKKLPASTIQKLIRSGLSDAEVYELIVPRRTLSHRLVKQQPLSAEESSRVIRVAKITTLAEQTFGEPERAWRWLRQPMRSLDGKSPLETLVTEFGARLVEEMILQIDHGIFA